MARLARVAVSDQPYHVTHRGNRRGQVFFSDADRRAYLEDLARCAAHAGLDIWGYCLMTNHIHLLVVPRRPESMARGLGRAQQRHARRIHAAQGWSGHLWANRFFSTPLDPSHLWTAIKYIEINPVRAGLATRAEDYAWSSARAHAARGKLPPQPQANTAAPTTLPDTLPDAIAADPAAPALLAPDRPFGGPQRHPLTGRAITWTQWLALGLDEAEVARLRRATSTGRPCGTADFATRLEQQLQRPLTPARRGRKPATAASADTLTPDLFDG